MWDNKYTEVCYMRRIMEGRRISLNKRKEPHKLCDFRQGSHRHIGFSKSEVVGKLYCRCFTGGYNSQIKNKMKEKWYNYLWENDLRKLLKN